MLTPYVSKGQTSDNFYVYTARMDHYYDSLIQARGTEKMQGTGYYGYMRWKEEWRHIIGPSGSISEAQLRVLDFAQRFNTIKTTMPKANANWKELGPIFLPKNIGEYSMHYGIGRIHAVAFNPTNASQVFAMSPTGGLYYSLDGGNTWNSGHTDNMNIVGVSYLVVDPQNSSRWYIGTGDCDGTSVNRCMNTSDGVYRTEDMGISWEQIFDTSLFYRPTRVRKLLMHPTNNNILFTVTDTAIYKTTNATAVNPIWNRVCSGSYNDLHYKPDNNNTMYASGYNGSKLLISTNGGDSFIIIPNTPFRDTTNIMIEFSPANPDLLFVTECYDTIQLHILNLSTNQWISRGWVKYLEDNHTYYLYNIAKGFAVTPTNANSIYIGDCYGNAIVHSSDQGQTWTKMDGDYHMDIHHLLYSSSGELWAGTDGGISKLTTSGWINKTSNIGVANLHYIAGAATDSNLVLMGAYDVGCNMLDKTRQDTDRWTAFNIGDGTSCAYDNHDKRRFYVAGQSGHYIKRTDDFGQHFTEISKFDETDFFTCLKLSPVVDSIVYLVALHDVYHSRELGNDNTWHPITTGITMNDTLKYFYKLYTSPNNADVMYMRDLATKWEPERWYKTTNANNSDPNTVTWSLFPVPKRGGDDLTVDSHDPNVLWIVHNNWRGDTAVLKFDGTSWHDLTYNLKDLHVYGLSSIVHDNLINTNGRIYAGGKRGVYYLDEGATEWILMDGLPNVQINQLEIDYNSGKLRASTYGRGLWEAPIANAYCNEPVVITGDSTLAAEAVSYCDIHVAPGAVFTITGKLHMAPGKKITIDKGGKLVLDAGILTGIRDQMWKGIEVWGDSSKSQSPPSNQGWFKAINNAVVENATGGIATIKGGRSYDYACTGGIIQANKTTFRNCTQAVAFYAFENRNPLNRKVIDNVSNFGNCAFEVNNNYTGADTVKIMVSLTQVRGIDFAGCRFVNNNTSALAAKSTGIFTFNSSFQVYSLLNCNVNPCFDTIHSEFNKLGYGIRALGAATSKTFKVDNAIFTANKYNGIYASGLDYITLIRNTFNINAADTNVTKPYGGSYFSQCKSYVIEENLYRKLSGSGVTVGLTINNSGPYNNQIYKNNFMNLNVGILAQSRNKSYQNNNVGLCFRCNNFSSNKYDIAVTAPLVTDTTRYYGVSWAQGSSSYPAGNLFTPSTYTPLQYNFYNLNVVIPPHSYDPRDITYYHHIQSGPYYTIPEKRTNVTLQPTYKPYGPDTCASHLSGGINPTDKMYQSDDLATAKAEELDALVDGGETDETVSLIVYSLPSEALQMHGELLQKSPYLSDTVMKEAVQQENVLNNALLRDVLVANPQSAKSDEVMTALDERTNPMPEYMQEEIEECVYIVSPKEQLEAEIAMARTDADSWYNRMVSDVLHDTTGIDIEALTALLDARPCPANAYYKAYQALEEGDTATGLQIMQNIKVEFGFNQVQTDEHNQIAEKYYVLCNLLVGNRPVQLIDSATAINLMQNISDNNIFCDEWLRNTLLTNGWINFSETYILPNETKSAIAEIPKQKKSSNEAFLRVYPNPANDYIVIEYHTGKPGSSIIAISDIMGRPVKQLALQKQTDQLVYITKNLVSGLYRCSLINDGRIKSTVKFSVIR